jgi:hypothetical protein
MSDFEIIAPNSKGKTQCIIRWMIETPSGWVGAWDKSALEQFLPVQKNQYPLPDDLFDSKDWRDADYAGRVAWLHQRYTERKKEIEDLYQKLESRK